MPLTEDHFTAIVDGGCTSCASKRLLVETLVLRALPLLGGEPYGAASWAYKGEDLVRGTYRIACAECDAEVFHATACPRCSAPDGVVRALETENTFALPRGCGGCGSELVTATAFVPAAVIYEGKRGAKARTQTAPEDPGFHGYRIECKACRSLREAPPSPCPLCLTPSGATPAS